MIKITIEYPNAANKNPSLQEIVILAIYYCAEQEWTPPNLCLQGRSSLFELEKERKPFNVEVTFKDLLSNIPFRNSSQLDHLVCYNCNSNKDLKLSKIISEPGKVIVLNLLSEPRTASKQIEAVYSKIDSTIKLTDLFDLKNKNYASKKYIIRGMICFRGLHYIYVGYFITLYCWFILNDEKCTSYPSWKSLRTFLIKNSWFPSLIFYEDKDYLSAQGESVVEDPFRKESKDSCTIF